MNTKKNLIQAFKKNLIAVKGEFVEDLSQFLDTIDAGNVLFESREIAAPSILKTLENKKFNVMFANELLDSGKYKDTVFDNTVLGITFPFLGIADTGTIIETSNTSKIRSLSLLPPVHLSILNQDSIVESMKDAIEMLKEKFKNDRGEVKLPDTITFITGPSRTADIEQTLTVGVHGPIRKAILII